MLISILDLIIESKLHWKWMFTPKNAFVAVRTPILLPFGNLFTYLEISWILFSVYYICLFDWSHSFDTSKPSSKGCLHFRYIHWTFPGKQHIFDEVVYDVIIIFQDIQCLSYDYLFNNKFHKRIKCRKIKCQWY